MLNRGMKRFRAAYKRLKRAVKGEVPVVLLADLQAALEQHSQAAMVTQVAASDAAAPSLQPPVQDSEQGMEQQHQRQPQPGATQPHAASAARGTPGLAAQPHWVPPQATGSRASQPAPLIPSHPSSRVPSHSSRMSVSVLEAGLAGPGAGSVATTLASAYPTTTSTSSIMQHSHTAIQEALHLPSLFSTGSHQGTTRRSSTNNNLAASVAYQQWQSQTLLPAPQQAAAMHQWAMAAAAAAAAAAGQPGASDPEEGAAVISSGTALVQATASIAAAAGVHLTPGDMWGAAPRAMLTAARPAGLAAAARHKLGQLEALWTSVSSEQAVLAAAHLLEGPSGPHSSRQGRQQGGMLGVTHKRRSLDEQGPLHDKGLKLAASVGVPAAQSSTQSAAAAAAAAAAGQPLVSSKHSLASSVGVQPHFFSSSSSSQHTRSQGGGGYAGAGPAQEQGLGMGPGQGSGVLSGSGVSPGLSRRSHTTATPLRQAPSRSFTRSAAKPSTLARTSHSQLTSAAQGPRQHLATNSSTPEAACKARHRPSNSAMGARSTHRAGSFSHSQKHQGLGSSLPNHSSGHRRCTAASPASSLAEPHADSSLFFVDSAATLRTTHQLFDLTNTTKVPHHSSGSGPGSLPQPSLKGQQEGQLVGQQEGQVERAGHVPSMFSSLRASQAGKSSSVLLADALGSALALASQLQRTQQGWPLPPPQPPPIPNADTPHPPSIRAEAAPQDGKREGSPQQSPVLHSSDLTPATCDPAGRAQLSSPHLPSPATSSPLPTSSRSLHPPDPGALLDAMAHAGLAHQGQQPDRSHSGSGSHKSALSAALAKVQPMLLTAEPLPPARRRRQALTPTGSPAPRRPGLLPPSLPAAVLGTGQPTPSQASQASSGSQAWTLRPAATTSSSSLSILSALGSTFGVRLVRQPSSGTAPLTPAHLAARDAGACSWTVLQPSLLALAGAEPETAALQPLHASSAALRLLGVSNAEEAGQMVEDVMVQDPSLLLQLETLISGLFKGHFTAFSHHLPIPLAGAAFGPMAGPKRRALSGLGSAWAAALTARPHPSRSPSGSDWPPSSPAHIQGSGGRGGNSASPKRHTLLLPHQMFVQLEFSACYVALDPGRQEAEPVLVILLQRMTPPAAPPAATPTPLTHTDPSLPLPTPAAATVLQLGQASQVAAGQQAVGAGAGPVQGPGAVGGGSGGAQLVSGSQLSSQLTFQLQLSHLALAHATAIITIMTLDGQVLYQNGRSVEYLGFMTGQAAAAGQSLHAPHHLLRRIFAADPLALDALMVATGQGQVWAGLVRTPSCLLPTPHPSKPGSPHACTTARTPPHKPLKRDPLLSAVNEDAEAEAAWLAAALASGRTTGPRTSQAPNVRPRHPRSSRSSAAPPPDLSGAVGPSCSTQQAARSASHAVGVAQGLAHLPSLQSVMHASYSDGVARQHSEPSAKLAQFSLIASSPQFDVHEATSPGAKPRARQGVGAAGAAQSPCSPQTLGRVMSQAGSLGRRSLLPNRLLAQRPGPPQPSAALIDQEKGMEGMQRALNLLGRKTGGGQPSVGPAWPGSSPPSTHPSPGPTHSLSLASVSPISGTSPCGKGAGRDSLDHTSKGRSSGRADAMRRSHTAANLVSVSLPAPAPALSTSRPSSSAPSPLGLDTSQQPSSSSQASQSGAGQRHSAEQLGSMTPDTAPLPLAVPPANQAATVFLAAGDGGGGGGGGGGGDHALLPMSEADAAAWPSLQPQQPAYEPPPFLSTGPSVGGIRAQHASKTQTARASMEAQATHAGTRSATLCRAACTVQQGARGMQPDPQRVRLQYGQEGLGMELCGQELSVSSELMFDGVLEEREEEEEEEEDDNNGSSPQGKGEGLLPDAETLAQPYCWHEVQAHLVPHPLGLAGSGGGCAQLLVLVQHDVTQYVEAQLEVKKVLDGSWRLLEEIFPLHVLQTMTSLAMTRSSSVRAPPPPTTLNTGQASMPAAAAANPEWTQAASQPQPLGALNTLPGHPPDSAQLQPEARPPTAAFRPDPVDPVASATEPTQTCLPGAAPQGALDASDCQQPDGSLTATPGAAASHTQTMTPIATSLAVPATSSCQLNCTTSGGLALQQSSHSSLLPPASHTSSAQLHSSSASPSQGQHRTTHAHSPGTARLSPDSLASSQPGGGGAGAGVLPLRRGSTPLANSPPGIPNQTAEPKSQPLCSRLPLNAAPTPSSASFLYTTSPGGRPSPGDAAMLRPGLGLQRVLPAPGAGSWGSSKEPSSARADLDAAAAASNSSMARHHKAVTVLFADIRGFTTMCNTLPPEEVMMFLNGMFTAFDALVEQHGLYKLPLSRLLHCVVVPAMRRIRHAVQIETIGDALMVAGGLLQVGPDGVARINDSPEGDTQHATKTLAFARDMLRTANTIVMPRGQPQDTVQLRVGIHTGSCMSGVVGRKMPRFCLFGDTINTASRMESTGQAQCVQVSQATWQALGHAPVLAADLLPPELVGAGGEQAGPGATYPAGVLRAEPRWRASGGVEAKGKGVMQTYVWKEQGWVQ
ncbi:hypothetical protein QJQ45_023407 [Haematococcus lacustris]|nr:hypothetical protein QJQ45_023407 [Haematococcus lacustris]